jgi:serine phosphatase RsbU (regulator of sigma subunit)
MAMREHGGRMPALFRLRARIAVLVAVGAVAVAAGVALLLGNTITLRDNVDKTLRSDQYLQAVGDVERLVVDAESGLRGYVITGRTLFLAPLHLAQSALPQAVVRLQSEAAADDAFIARAQGLNRAAQSYLATYATKLLAMAKSDIGAARSFAETLTGKHLVDNVRNQTRTLEGLVAARQTARQRAAHGSASDSIAEAIVVLGLLVALTIVIGALLGRLVLARELAREGSDRTSRILQESLLPGAVPEIPGCELAVRFRPAASGDLVGGDFYDVFEIGSGEWAIVIGDVCGKGAAAAAVTAMARWTLRSFSADPLTPEAALRRLNETMLRQELGTRFITLAYMKLTLDPDGAQLSIACGGHPAPILVPADGAPTSLPARGTLLGVWSDIELDAFELRLLPGDGIVAYTDGVTDQGSQFRPATPGEMLGAHPPAGTAEQLAGAVERFARQPGGEQRDDIAILALRLDSAGEKRPGEEGPVEAVGSR